MPNTFTVYYDDCDHKNEIATFHTEEEALTFLMTEIEKFKSTPEEYVGVPPDEWTEEPTIELATSTVDGGYIDCLYTYSLEGGLDKDADYDYHIKGLIND